MYIVFIYLFIYLFISSKYIDSSLLMRVIGCVPIHRHDVTSGPTRPRVVSKFTLSLSKCAHVEDPACEFVFLEFVNHMRSRCLRSDVIRTGHAAFGGRRL